MRRGALFVLSAGLVVGGAGAASEPSDCRPETWFHLIGGNVSKAGLTADLEAVAAAGFGGVQLFHGQVGSREAWPGTAEQIPCLSPKWEETVRHAADECRRLGLSFKMQNCPGWSMSGGPWIGLDRCMRQLDVRAATTTGGVVAVDLPVGDARQPPQDWRDIRTVAYPLVAGEAEPLPPPVAATSPDSGWLSSNALAIVTSALKAPGRAPVGIRAAPGAATLAFDYAAPVTARTLEITSPRRMNHGWSYRPDVSVTLSCEEADGWRTVGNWRMPRSNWQDDAPLSLSFPRTTARHWRVRFDFQHPFQIASIRLHGAARMQNWEGLSGRVLRSRLDEDPPVADEPADCVDPARVLDVSRFLDPASDVLRCALPPGRWRILRIGHVNAGLKNQHAPAEATGWECDKLSTSGVEASFAGYVGRLTAPGGSLAGCLAGIVVDSWECRTQSWTPGLDRRFADRYGYPLDAWWPALFGRVVGDRERTRRFLNDWTRLLGDSVEQAFYGRLGELARARGLTCAFETAAGDVLPGDVMAYFKHADVPMCEFWSPRSESYCGWDEYKPKRPTVSAAHLYGKRRVAAEAFTSKACTWDETPRDWKGLANLHLADGITHLVFHTVTHQPQVGFLPPGSSFGTSIGSPFVRGQTWWPHLPLFTGYLARCTARLEEGGIVKDVLLYLGDEPDHRPLQDLPFPEGHDYDYLNADVLISRLAAKDGAWRTPEGLVYRLVWLPCAARMRPETLARLVAGAEAGSPVLLGARPGGCATLAGGAAAEGEVRRLAARLWDSARANVFHGAGAADVAAALAALGVQPDVAGGGARLKWLHRRVGTLDRYFLCSSDGESYAGEISLRAAGKAVRVYDPTSGRTCSPVSSSVSGGRRRLRLDLARGQALFVETGDFDEAPPPAHDAAWTGFAVRTLDAPWRLTFAKGWGCDEGVTISALRPWCELPVSEEARAYSGTVRYETTFTLPDGQPPHLFLDLGAVASIARVWLNGQDLGTVWSEPHVVDGSAAVRAGENRLAVEVTSAWRNRLVYDAGLPPWRRKTWTTRRPSGGARTPYGLLGPVRLLSAGPRRVTLLDGADWNVPVPHTWNVQDGSDGRDVPPGARPNQSAMRTSYRRGSFTYVRDLPPKSPWPRRQFLEFEGASQKAVVRVNGREVGRHDGAFTSFCFEITDALGTASNRLEVVVDNTYDPECLPVNADYTMYGGLYRSVRLLDCPTSCIDPRVPVRLDADCATGTAVARYVLSTPTGAVAKVQTRAYPGFARWSPENPRLYSFDLVEGVDCLSVPFGFRTAEFRDGHFYLNDERLFLKGVNRHQDKAGKGWALSPEDEEEDVRLMKEMGCNVVRTSHYPQSRHFLDLCDRLGLIVWSEMPLVDLVTPTETFRSNLLSVVDEAVGERYSHPSICLWSVFNELYNFKTPPMPDGTAEPFVQEATDLVRRLDRSRPTVCGSNQRTRKSINVITDEFAINLYPGWYGRQDPYGGMVEQLQEVFGVHGKTFAVSEYGGGACVEQHDDPARRPPSAGGRWHPEEYQAYLHWGNYKAICESPYVWGAFVWCMFDFAADCRQEGFHLGYNDKGLVTADRRTRKDAFYFYQANWGDGIPVLHLVGARRTETKEAATTVLAFSNVGEVTLSVNGKTVGRQVPDAVRTVIWRDVSLERDANEIRIEAGGHVRTARLAYRPSE